MTTDRGYPKNDFNISWGRISDDGDQAVPTDVDPSGALANQGHEPLVDGWGRPWVRVASSGSSFAVQTGWYRTAALANMGTIKTTPGTLLQAFGFNTDPNNMGFFQLHDDAAAPPPIGAVAEISIPVQPNYGTFSVSINQPDYGVPGFPVPFETNGIVWVVSSNPVNYQVSALLFQVTAVYI